jgi:hypothetical protein
MGISSDEEFSEERQKQAFFCIFLWVFFFSPWAAGPKGKKTPR